MDASRALGHSPATEDSLSLRNGIAVGFFALFLAWMVTVVPMGRLGETLSGVSPWALVWVAGVFLVQQFLRAWRQQILVQSVCPESSYRGNLSVLCMSFFCINTFPARLGELVRPALLAEKEGVPVGAGFSIVFIERLIDLLVALGVLLTALSLMELPSTVVEVKGISIDFPALVRTVAFGVLLPVFVVLFGLSIAPRLGVVWMERALRFVVRFLPEKIGQKIQSSAGTFVSSFVSGIQILRQPRRLLAILALTALTWGLTGFLYVGLANGFESLHGQISWGQGMTILVITMLGTAIPSLPGFAAVYEGAVVAAFVLLGIGTEPEVVALAFALIVHWWTYAVQSVTAFYFFFRDGVRVSDLRDHTRRSHTA